MSWKKFVHVLNWWGDGIAGFFLSAHLEDKGRWRRGVKGFKKRFKNFEERRYEASRWMTTELEGSYTRAVYLGFMRLFWYINGNNAVGEKIPMTTPVITRVAPTTDGKHLTNVSVAFFVSPQVADPPKPNDESIHLSSFSAGNFYVRSFGGFALEQDYIKNIKALVEDLKVAGLPFDDQHYIIAGYDPPFRSAASVTQLRGTGAAGTPASAESAASSTAQEGTFELSELKVLLAELTQDIKESEKANEKATAKALERLKQELKQQMKQANECLRQEFQQANERLRQEVQLELRQVLGKIEERIEKNSLN
ncbi:HEBP1 protein, partial [Polypterus senegalus]